MQIRERLSIWRRGKFATLEMRVSSEQWARGAGRRKGWGSRRDVQGEGAEGGGRAEAEAAAEGIWGRPNTNMRIKAVEGIKAYNRGADLRAVSAYPFVRPTAPPKSTLYSYGRRTRAAGSISTYGFAAFSFGQAQKLWI
ncbi:hypothetical protein KM043_016036 [Ampulex compressa]|nr:hypothetical protein KM043_016036 [Ampulex compressa]